MSRYGHCNDTPSQFAVTHALNTVKSLKEKRQRILEELDKSITQATAEYVSLVNQRAPSARLPIELMALIFEIAHATALSQKTAVEMVVSQVSKRWREIAIGHSLLWTCIEVSSRRPTGSLQNYIQRSGVRPVTVTLELIHLEGWKVENIWHHLEGEIHRWRRLSISADSWPSLTIYPILQGLHLSLAPLLEDIKIELNEYNESAERPEPDTILLAGAPKLTSIRLDGLFLYTNRPPLLGVTTLFLHNPLPESCFLLEDLRAFITGFPSLINLSIYGDILESDYPETFSPEWEIILPGVRALRIRSDHWGFDNYSDFLIMITAPALETLHLIDIDDEDVEWFISSRNEEQLEKFPKLSTLIVQDSEISQDMYEGLATAFPSVEHLTCVNNLEPALVVLCDSHRWPNISTISLWGDTNEEVNNFLVRDALRARIENGRPITKLCIANKPPLFPNFLLREYVSLEYMRPVPLWPAWSGIFEEL